MQKNFVRYDIIPPEAPPASVVGAVPWLKKNLFASVPNTLLTLALLWIIYTVTIEFFNWAVVSAVWSGQDREACLAKNVGYAVGACWPFVLDKLPQWIYGLYPTDQRWRVDTVYALGIFLIIPLAIPSVPFKTANVIAMFVVYPIVTVILLTGGVLGLEHVETRLWGGLFVTLIVSAAGIVFSLPIGILLALGRRSSMPLVRLVSVIFIEFWRGVPLITILFMASNMLPLFLPEGVNFDKLLRALIGVALFSAAYMAEVVRGGLQAIPRGQYEGAQALGINYWKMMYFIVMPQALKLVIPGIVNIFIALFKDTTLVSIIGLYDLLGIVQDAGLRDPSWSTPSTAWTAYISLCIIYWIFCFGMSRYSIFMEERLHTGHKRA